MTDTKPTTIIVTNVVEHEDGSATYSFDMDSASSSKLVELGMEFVLTCAAYKLDIQDALDLLAKHGKSGETQKDLDNEEK